MNHLRVLVLGDGSLLGSGIRDLLSREADLEIVDRADDGTSPLIEQISCMGADVVVVDGMSDPAHRTRILSVLERCPDLRVVVVDADTNRVRIYERHRVIIRQAADLVDIVRGVQRRP
jgi:chemotaxis response regulator CheB